MTGAINEYPVLTSHYFECALWLFLLEIKQIAEPLRNLAMTRFSRSLASAQ